MGVVSSVRDLAPAFEKMTGHKVIVIFDPTPVHEREDQFRRAGGHRRRAASAGRRTDQAGQDGGGHAHQFRPGRGGRRRQGGRAQARHQHRRGLQGGDAQRQVDRLFPRRQRHHLRSRDGEARHRRSIEGDEPSSSTAARSPRTWQRAWSRSGCSRSTSSFRSKAPTTSGRCRRSCRKPSSSPAACSTVSKEPEVARAFLRFIASPEAAPLIRKSAMEPWS